MDIEKANYDDKWIYILISFLFVIIMAIGFINSITNLIYPNQIDTILCYVVLLCLIAKAAIPVIKRLTRFDFLAMVIIGLVFFVSAVFYRNSFYILEFMPRFLLVVLPYFLLGRVIRNFDLLYKYLKPCMIAAALFGAGGYMVLYVSGQPFIVDDMSFAYHYLPCVIFLMFELLQRFSLKILLLCLISIATLLLTGTRGPIVCLLAAVVLYFLWFEKNKTKKIILSIIFLALIILVITGWYYDIIYQLNEFLQRNGIYNRIVDKILDKDLLDSSGRDIIQEKIIAAIKSEPFLGHGIMGDRDISGGSYAHNIFLEFLCQFGVVFGSILLASMIVIFVIAFKRFKSRSSQLFLMLMFCSGFVKLFLSFSYIEESYFALLIGLCLNTAHLISKNSPELHQRKPVMTHENLQCRDGQHLV